MKIHPSFGTLKKSEFKAMEDLPYGKASAVKKEDEKRLSKLKTKKD